MTPLYYLMSFTVVVQELWDFIHMAQLFISLNFISIFVTGKVEHNLSAARKKDIDDSNGYKPHHRDPHPVNTRGQQSKPDSVLQASE